jgi:hypothetical protein
MILVAVEQDSEGSLLSDELRFGLGTLLDDSAVLVQHALDLTPSNVHESDLSLGENMARSG